MGNQMQYNPYQQPPMQQYQPQQPMYNNQYNQNYAQSQQQQQFNAPPPPSVDDKNKAFLAKMRAKQAAKKQNSTNQTDFDNEEETKPKITLFGANELNNASLA